MSFIRSSSSLPSDSAGVAAYTSPCWCHNRLFSINLCLAMWSDISYSDSILLFWHLLHEHFTSRWSPAQASSRKFFAISNHSAECAPLSPNPSYISCRSWAIFNTVGSLHEGNLVFIVKVVELNAWQKSFNSTKASSLQREFTIYVFSSLQNNWNYMFLSNLIGTKNTTGCFWPTRGQKQPVEMFVPIKLHKCT
jgi:hypothetical protein